MPPNENRPISGYALQNIGFKKTGVETPKGVQVIIAIYKRGEDEIRYDGVSWSLNGNLIHSMNDIK